MIQLPLMVMFFIVLFANIKKNKLPSANRENIQRVFFGDSEESVKLKMGESEEGFFDVSNPLKRESFKSNDKMYEIWYYATDRVGTKDWEDEATPVVFESGKVAAIGWMALKRLGFISSNSSRQFPQKLIRNQASKS